MRPAVYHILLALLGHDRHGLGIADEIERASKGAVALGPGTLYRSLSEMVDARLIEAVRAPSADADPRRKYYRITKDGKALLKRETVRLHRLVETARAQGALPQRA
jgi:DNA-binding PadR family transcriptional regulator